MKYQSRKKLHRDCTLPKGAKLRYSWPYFLEIDGSVLCRVVTVLEQDRSDRSWSSDQGLVFWDIVGPVHENHDI